MFNKKDCFICDTGAIDETPKLILKVPIKWEVEFIVTNPKEFKKMIKKWNKIEGVKVEEIENKKIKRRFMSVKMLPE